MRQDNPAAKQNRIAARHNRVVVRPAHHVGRQQLPIGRHIWFACRHQPYVCKQAGGVCDPVWLVGRQIRFVHRRPGCVFKQPGFVWKLNGGVCRQRDFVWEQDSQKTQRLWNATIHRNKSQSKPGKEMRPQPNLMRQRPTAGYAGGLERFRLLVKMNSNWYRGLLLYGLFATFFRIRRSWKQTD